jgi:hypothetical protein
MVNRVWTPSLYGYGEGNTSRLFGAWGSTGVQENSMLPRLVKREPRKSRASQVETEIEVLNQGVIPRRVSTPTLDVRWRNCSEEVG